MSPVLQRIGVIHLNQIGDLVFALPLLYSLRQNCPDAEITSILKPNLVELLEGSSLVNRLLVKEDGFAAKWNLLRAIRGLNLDLLICLARSEEGLLLSAASKAKIKAGFKNPPWDFALDIKETIEGHNSWHNNAKLLKALDIPIAQNNYVGLLPVKPVPQLPDLPSRYVVISAGASARRLIKAWDEEKFAHLIKLLSKNYGLAAVLVGGADSSVCNSEIKELALENSSLHESQVLDLSGKLSLQQLLAVLRRASLFVGIDSGVMHLASSLDIPTVGLFGPTDPDYVGPQNNRSAVARAELACMPCYVNPSCSNYDCMRELTTTRVWQDCVRLLDDAPS